MLLCPQVINKCGNPIWRSPLLYLEMSLRVCAWVCLCVGLCTITHAIESHIIIAISDCASDFTTMHASMYMYSCFVLRLCQMTVQNKGTVFICAQQLHRIFKCLNVCVSLYVCICFLYVCICFFHAQFCTHMYSNVNVCICLHTCMCASVRTL